MTTMVERVAIAMRQELGVDWPYVGHAALMDTARAAIKAMREPSEAMQEAGEWYAGSQAGECFTAMIDAILKEQA